MDIDSDSTYTTGDKLLYTWKSSDPVPFDPVGSHNTIILTIPEGKTFPSGVPSTGTYPLGAAITGTVTGEIVTANNVGVSSPVSFVSSAVDITLDYMSTTLASNVPETGGSLPLTLRFYNNGDDTLTSSFKVHFYASNALALTPTLDLGEITVTEDIAAGKRILVNASLTIPPAVVAFYTVYWDIDPLGDVEELDETNKTVTSANSCFVYFIASDGHLFRSHGGAGLHLRRHLDL